MLNLTKLGALVFNGLDLSNNPIPVENSEAATWAAEIEKAIEVGASFIDSIASVSALSASNGALIYLSVENKHGLFKFDSSDLSAKVALDTRQGLYIAPDSDATGASGAWVRQFYGDRMLSWFMLDADTDQAAAVNASFVDASSGGVTVFANVSTIQISSADVTIPSGCHFKGPLANPGEVLPGASADYDALNGVLQISSSRNFYVAQRATVEGLVVLRDGLDLPFADATAATTGIAAFAGKAFQVSGPDATFKNLLIIGFEYAVYSDAYERVRCDNVYGDCTNGIYIEESYDVAYISDCHFWPYTTVHQTWTTNALLRRTGTAFKFANVGDWTKIYDCFSYGYFRGFWGVSCDELNFINCGADNTSTSGTGDHSGSFGFLATGGCLRPKFIACQAAAQQSGYYIDNTDGNTALLDNCTAWGTASNGVQVVSGDVNITGGELAYGQYGVYVTTATAKVNVLGVSFKDQSVRPVHGATSTDKIFYGANNRIAGFSGHPVSGTTLATIASADPLAVPQEGDVFYVSGTTNFGNISGGWAGRKITLIFQGALTITHSANITLAGSANFAVTAGDTLTLVFKSSTSAAEIGRGDV